MREDTCRLHAPALAALEELEELGLDAEDVEAARAHLAGCARCQARRRAWARLDGALRGSLAPTAATPALATADLLAAIGADHEPSERRTPMLSVITVRDEDIMDDETRGTTATEAGETASAPEAGAPARTFAPLPSLKPARRLPGWRRGLTGMVAVVAVAALIGGITGAMALTGRLSGTQSANHGRAAATQTAQAVVTRPDGLTAYHIAGLSMDSATDGWMVMEAQDANGISSAVILRISNGVVSKQATLPGMGGFQANIQALSPTNAWLMFPMGQDNLYHYDGTGWMLIHLPAPANAMDGSLSILGYRMISPTEGYAVGMYGVATAISSTTSVSILKLAFYRYDGSAWHIEPADNAATVGGFPDPNSTPASYSETNIQITGVSAAPGGEAWATGYLQTNDSNGNTTTLTSYIYHRAGGVWRLAQTLSHDQLIGVAMSGPGSGWIIGQNIQTKKAGGTVAPYTITIQTPIALRWDGARWSPAAIPQPTPEQAGSILTQVIAASPSNVWIMGTSTAMTINSGPYASDNTYLVHFDGARWSRASLPQVAATNPTHNLSVGYQMIVSNLAVSPSGDLWLGGGLSVQSNGSYQWNPLLYHYTGGQWSNVALPALPPPTSTPASGTQAPGPQG